MSGGSFVSMLASQKGEEGAKKKGKFTYDTISQLHLDMYDDQLSLDFTTPTFAARIVRPFNVYPVLCTCIIVPASLSGIGAS